MLNIEDTEQPQQTRRGHRNVYRPIKTILSSNVESEQIKRISPSLIITVVNILSINKLELYDRAYSVEHLTSRTKRIKFESLIYNDMKCTYVCKTLLR